MASTTKSRPLCQKTSSEINSSSGKCADCWMRGAESSCLPSASTMREVSTTYLVTRLALLLLRMTWLRVRLEHMRFKAHLTRVSLWVLTRSSQLASTIRASTPSSSPETSKPTRSHGKASGVCFGCSKGNCHPSSSTSKTRATGSSEPKPGTGESSSIASGGN